VDDDKLRISPSNKLFFAAAAVACAIACAGSAELAQEGITMIAIEKMDVGSAPADFDFGRTGQGGPGQWGVTSDPSATGGRAIEQSSTDRTDYRFPLAIYKPISAKNVDVSLRFKAVAGSVDQAGGIALRLIDPDNYYVLRANALEDNVRFYRVTNGRRVQIAGANIKVSGNECTRSASRPRANASPLCLTARSSTRRPIIRSPPPVKSRFGPRPTA
jgi:hypothetical protein